MPKHHVLLPQPRQLDWRPGECRLEGERYISLSGSITTELLHTGRTVQRALAEAGASWELTAGGAGRPYGAVVAQDPALVGHPEGYRLSIRPDEVRLIGADAAGVFYGAQTLKQIARQAAGTGALPCVEVLDWPDFANRGASADISRNRVPTMDYLYSLVDMLSEWKINQFSLHMEHTFAYRKHRRVWENASPMTGEEILLLDQYCRERFIELVPYQACFGHMETWFQYEEYQHLAEVPFDWDVPAEEFEHAPSVSKHCRATMNPTDPRTYEFVDELFGELLPHFSSRQVYAPMDEPQDLGKGRSKQLCEEKGFDRVYFEYVRDVARLIERRGRTVQFWGYPVRTHPEWASEMPAGTIAHTFPHTADRLAEARMPFYVGAFATGVLSITGTTDHSTQTVRKGVENGLKYGADGIWTYEFGDEGHWHTPPVTMIGYAHGAALSWALQANRDASMPEALDAHVFRDGGGVMGKLAWDLGNVYTHPGLSTSRVPDTEAAEVPPDTTSDPLWPILQGAIGVTDPGDRWSGAWEALFRGDRPLTIEGLDQAIGHIDEVMAPLSGARMARPDAELIADEFRLGAAMQKHACRLGQALLSTTDKSVAGLSGGTRKGLADELGPIVKEYRRLWLLRSRQGGLDHSAGLLERPLAAYEA